MKQPYKEVRKLLHKYADDLELLLPDYKSYRHRYSLRHHEVKDRVVKKDLEYIKRILKL